MQSAALWMKGNNAVEGKGRTTERVKLDLRASSTYLVHKLNLFPHLKNADQDTSHHKKLARTSCANLLRQRSLLNLLRL